MYVWFNWVCTPLFSVCKTNAKSFPTYLAQSKVHKILIIELAWVYGHMLFIPACDRCQDNSKTIDYSYKWLTNCIMRQIIQQTHMHTFRFFFTLFLKLFFFSDYTQEMRENIDSNLANLLQTQYSCGRMQRSVSEQQRL